MSTTTSNRDHVEHYIGRLQAAAFRHRAVNHPYLAALATGKLPNHQAAVADFAEQYSNYSRLFTLFLTTLEPNLESHSHRQSIRENIAEESGSYDEHALATIAAIGLAPVHYDGVPHHDLFIRFTKAVGGRAHEPTFAVRRWGQAMLQLMSRPGGHEGVGALGIGTELIVPMLYQSIESALRFIPNLTPRDRAFFTIHGPVDAAHQEDLKQIAIELAQDYEGRRRITRGMFEALEHRACLWDCLYERAFNQTMEAVA